MGSVEYLHTLTERRTTMKFIKWPPISTLDDVTLTDRERELAAAIIGEVIDIYINYNAFVRAYLRKEQITRHEARVKARRWIYDHRLSDLFL